jgi:SAM-dependent methyltransferase
LTAMNTRLHTTPDPLSDGHRLAHTAGEKWEQFAHDDPYSYILTTLKGVDIREFWKSGERTVQKEFFPLLEARGVRPLLALELGCGVGRLVIPLARRFREATGVDISRGMIERAISFAHDNGIENVSFVAISGPVDFLRQARSYAGSCDFIYSLLVFQHIPDLLMIEGYLHVIRHLLHKQGLAYLQFDTRPKTFAYHLKTRLPDFLLPRFWRRGIRRIRRSIEELEAAVQRAGLEIVDELTPHTAYHRYILRLAQRTAGSK